MENRIVRYFHCGDCYQEKSPPMVTVGVSREGDLIVYCERHGRPIFELWNRSAGEELLALAGAGCGGEEHKKEQIH